MPRTAILALLLAGLAAGCGHREETSSRADAGPGSRPARAEAPTPPAPGAFSLVAGADGVPGQPPPVRITGDATGVTVDVARVAEPARLLPLLLDPAGPPPPEDAATRVWSGTGRAGNAPFIPPLPAGLYLVTARRGGLLRRVPLSVADLTIVAERSAGEILVLVTEASSGRAVPGAHVTIREPKGTKEGVADSEGVYRTATSTPAAAAVLATSGDRVAMARVGGEGGSPPGFRGWIAPERAAVRAGEELPFTAFGLRREAGGWRPAPGASVPFALRDRSGILVAAGEAAGVGPGVVHGAARVPADTPPGPARLAAVFPDGTATGGIRVLPRDPPALRLEVAAPRLGVRGSPTAFRIRGEYSGASPAARIAVRYIIAREGAPREAPPAVSGEGVLDADGALTVRFTPDAPGSFSLAAETADPVAGTIRARATIHVAGAAFGIRLVPVAGFVTSDAAPAFRVELAPGSRPAGPIRGTVRLGEVERGFTLDPANLEPVEVSFPPREPGECEAVARAPDARGRSAEARARIFVTGESLPDFADGIRVIPEHGEYAAGERARFLLLFPDDDVGMTILETLSGTALGVHSVETVGRRMKVLELLVPEHLGPRVRLEVTAVGAGRVERAAATISVRAPDRGLTVDLASADDGAPDRLAVSVTEPGGGPVAASGVAWVYPVGRGPRATLSARAALSARDRDPIVRTTSRDGAFRDGPAATAPGAGGPGKAAPPPEGAYPSPLVFFPDLSIPVGGLPLDLPPAGSRGAVEIFAGLLAPDGRVGDGYTERDRPAPFLVRLLPPRFLLAGDVTVVRARAEEVPGEPPEGRISLSADGLFLLAPSELPLGPEPIEIAVPASAPHSGSARVRARVEAGGRVAAAEARIPVRPAALPRTGSLTGSSRESQFAIYPELPLGLQKEAANLTLTLCGSPLGAVELSQASLRDTPPGDAEDVLGAILPGALLSARLPDPEGTEPETARRTLAGLAELTRRRNPDGGWGEGGVSDPTVTARILAGLAALSRAGVEMDAPLVGDAARWLEGELDGGLAERDPVAAAAALRAVAIASGEVGAALERLSGETDRLTEGAWADLIVAALAVRKQWLAIDLAGRLKKRGIRDEAGGVHWGAEGDDPVVTTALVVRALLRLPAEVGATDLVDRGVRYLLLRRRGVGWGSPRRTGEADLALLAATPDDAGTPEGDVGLRIRAGDAIVATLRVSLAGFARRGTTVLVPGRYLSPGRNRISVEVAGARSAWWTLESDLAPTAEPVPPEERGFEVTRTTRRIGTDGRLESIEGAVDRGTPLATTVLISSEVPRRRVLVECPVPAGAVPMAGDPGRLGSDLALPPGTEVERRDDRVVLFLPHLPGGETRVTVLTRTIWSGKYLALPATVRLADDPDVRGRSTCETLVVR